ncbi:MAG: ribosome maturation factor RimP [Egibacteraceae bacterium]
MTADVSASIRSLAVPLARAGGAVIVDVQVKGAGSRTLVRVVADRKGGIDIATCQELSRRLSAALDAADPIDGRYVLEVTSPGLDYPLTDRAAFDRVEGRAVLVGRHAPNGSPVQVRGTVTAAEDDAVCLDVDGEAVRVPYGEIIKATQALPW